MEDDSMFRSKKQGAVHVVSGSVCLSQEIADDVRVVFADCLSQGQPRIVLDLEFVPLMDSSGLELLLDTQDECARRGGTLRLAAPNPLCRDILVATGVADHFEVHEDVLTAVGSFAV